MLTVTGINHTYAKKIMTDNESILVCTQFSHIQLSVLPALKILMISGWFHKSIPKGFDKSVLHFALMDFVTRSNIYYSEQNTMFWKMDLFQWLRQVFLMKLTLYARLRTSADLVSKILCEYQRNKF
jgi:hypothetical protein